MTSLPSKMISQRGQVALHVDTFSASLQERMKNKTYHKIHNTKGVINMGTAVNRLMEKDLEERLGRGDALKFTSANQHYYDFSGTEELRTAVSSFLNRHFNPIEDVVPDNIVVMNGVTSCLDALGHTLCDPGDVIISPTPVYGRIFTDFTDRSRVKIMPLHLPHEPNSNGVTFELTSEALDRRIQELKTAEENVRGFILLNPQNPLGEIYPPDLVLQLAGVCARYGVHFMIDEIYALSPLDPQEKFVSCLSLQMPDPERTHFLWGFSKDFGLAGFRAGVIHTRNKDILACLRVVGVYQATANIVHQAVATLINDVEWCDKFFIPTNQRRLQCAYKRACDMLREENIQIRQSHAGFFLWIHVAPFLNPCTEQTEMELFEEIFQAGLYIVPGTKTFTKPGWFRIVFSVSDEEITEGMKRLIKVLNIRRSKR